MAKSKDISGLRKGRLTVLYRLEGQNKRRSAMWRCRCDCGNETDLSLNELLHTRTASCGCGKADWGRKMAKSRPLLDGTAMDVITRDKPASNTSGYKGVYIYRGKYMAQIKFNRKTYYLGLYSDIQDAVEVRGKAEALLFGSTLDYYSLWQKKASEAPEWAEANPPRISVEKDGSGQFVVSFRPELEEND